MHKHKSVDIILCKLLFQIWLELCLYQLTGYNCCIMHLVIVLKNYVKTGGVSLKSCHVKYVESNINLMTTGLLSRFDGLCAWQLGYEKVLLYMTSVKILKIKRDIRALVYHVIQMLDLCHQSKVWKDQNHWTSFIRWYNSYKGILKTIYR